MGAVQCGWRVLRPLVADGSRFRVSRRDTARRMNESVGTRVRERALGLITVNGERLLRKLDG